VRAAVCARLGLNDPVFDAAVNDFLAGQRGQEAPFRLNLDRAQYGVTPPSEQVLIMKDRAGREQRYYLLSLLPVTRKETA
jgi:hypothetical protein